MLDDEMKPTVYSLQELCDILHDSIETLCPKECWVRAEIGSITVKSGNCYMELIEKNVQGDTLAAKMRATCWSNTYAFLSPYFLSETGQNLQAGLQVLLCGNITFHSVYGLSFQIISIDPSYTIGDIARQRRETIERLQKEGLMDLQKGLELPLLLQHIAVISSHEAAGYEDFCNQLHNNPAHFYYHTELFPAIVQGDRAEKSIIDAMQQIKQRLSDFQAVVIIRGGGATTDLKCFDSYALASYCAQFPLPVIAGIGHQRDVSVLDMVVHTNVKTPTAAAEFIIAHTMEQQEHLLRLYQRLQIACMQPVLQEKQRLICLQSKLQHTFSQILSNHKSCLQMLEKSLALHSPEHLYKMGYSLTTCQGKPIHSINEVKSGDELNTELIDGTLTSVVK